MRAVLDPNVLISAVLSPRGAPANVLRSWLEGRFDLIASPQLLAELERALGYPKLRDRVSATEAARLVAWVSKEATIVSDPEEPPTVPSPDPGDDYLIALAERTRAALVSGDQHLLTLADKLPVLTPRQFLDTVGRGS